jgi:hypothetical protein
LFDRPVDLATHGLDSWRDVELGGAALVLASIPPRQNA